MGHYDSCREAEEKLKLERRINVKSQPTPKPDPVNSPEHYTVGGLETIDVMQAKLSEEEFRGYCKGNVLKYLCRSEYKGKSLEDLKKAAWYLNKLIETHEND